MLSRLLAGAEVNGTTVNVTATDDSAIRVISGAAGGAGTVSLGAATALNTLNGSARAIVDNADITATTVNVSANATGEIESLAAIGTGAGTAAINLSLAKNDIANVIEALCDRHGLTLLMPPLEAARASSVLARGYSAERRLEPEAVSPDTFVELHAGFMRGLTVPRERRHP